LLQIKQQSFYILLSLKRKKSTFEFDAREVGERENRLKKLDVMNTNSIL